jgi:hypothetical protein
VVGCQRHDPGRFTPGKDPVPPVWEAGLAPGSVWTDTENNTVTGFRTPTIRPVAIRYNDWPHLAQAVRGQVEDAVSNIIFTDY